MNELNNLIEKRKDKNGNNYYIDKKTGKRVSFSKYKKENLKNQK